MLCFYCTSKGGLGWVGRDDGLYSLEGVCNLVCLRCAVGGRGRNRFASRAV